MLVVDVHHLGSQMIMDTYEETKTKTQPTSL